MKNLAIVYVQGTSKKYEQEIYLINELKAVSAKIFIICDESDNIEDILKIDKKYLIKGKFRNRIAAYRYAYSHFKLGERTFENLIVCDNSFFGPFVKFSEIFKTMETKKLDCWTLSKYTEMYDKDYWVSAEHIDSSFIYFSNRIVEGKVFREFWNEESSDDQLIEEIKLTGCIDIEGLKRGTYIEYTSLDAEKIINNMDWLKRLPYTMLQENNSPILKKDCFVENDFRYTSENEALKAIEYVKKYTAYDENIIWDYLLENYDIGDIINILHLHCVLSENQVLSPIYNRKKCAIILHITYLKAIEKAFVYIKEIPEEIDLYITSKGTEYIELIENRIKQIDRRNCKILLAGDRGRDVSALLVTCRDILMKYEYLCFVHDNKTRNNIGPAVIGESYMLSRWDNTIRDAGYISSVLELFEKNERLGIVVPPVPYSGGQFIALGWTWSGDYEVTLDLAERLGLTVSISKEKYNYSIGTTFWCRTEAMRKLFESEFTYDDFPPEPVLASSGTISHAIERIFLYVAQDAGYYAAVIENNEYAAGHINDLNYMLNKILNRSKVPVSGYFDLYLNNMDISRLENFVKSNEQVYIYGDGYIAHQMSDLLKRENLKYESYVISDGRKKKEKEENVIYFSEMPCEKAHIGIIVALSGYYQRQVVPDLREKGCLNLYIV